MQKKARQMPVFQYVIFFISIILVLSGCTTKQTEEPLDVNNLSGRSIGVMLGYSSDYILTNDNKDVDIRRYEANSDMMLALSFNQLDAVALEMDEAYVFCRLEPEYMIYDTFMEKEAYGYVLNPNSKELNEQFNSFIAEFRQTDLYKDIERRIEESAKQPYENKPVENITTADATLADKLLKDKTLNVLVYDGWEPISYLNTETNQWEGADIELITHFANSIGAKIEFSPIGSYTQSVLDLSLGKADLFLCPDSLRLKVDLEKGGHVTMSDCVWEKDIVFVINSSNYQKESSE